MARHPAMVTFRRLLAAFMLFALCVAAWAGEESGDASGTSLTLHDLEPGVAEPDRPAPVEPHDHAGGLIVTPPGFPRATGAYRDGPTYYFETEQYHPHLPAEPDYFNHSETYRWDGGVLWDGWRDGIYHNLRESGPRPQYGVSRPSDPVRLEPNRRYEWRDRFGGQNVRRPHESPSRPLGNNDARQNRRFNAR